METYIIQPNPADDVPNAVLGQYATEKLQNSKQLSTSEVLPAVASHDDSVGEPVMVAVSTSLESNSTVLASTFPPPNELPKEVKVTDDNSLTSPEPVVKRSSRKSSLPPRFCSPETTSNNNNNKKKKKKNHENTNSQATFSLYEFLVIDAFL